jgi:hypothetical protein
MSKAAAAAKPAKKPAPAEVAEAATRGGARAGAGRMAYAPEDKRRPRSIALTDAQWEKYKALGTEWLIERLNRAKVA